MTIEFGFTNELVNTQFAPLAAIFAHYQQDLTLKPLESVVSLSKHGISALSTSSPRFC